MPGRSGEVLFARVAFAGRTTTTVNVIVIPVIMAGMAADDCAKK